MKKLIPFLLIVISISFIPNKTKAQLVAGDIAFTGYISNQSSVADQFTFVVLANISIGTVIKFTDNGWLSSNVFNNTETILSFTATTNLVPGNELKIVSGVANATLSSTGAIAGNVTVLSGGAIAFPSSGDQILAYQGVESSPTFISAIHMNTYQRSINLDCASTTPTTWDPDCVPLSNNFSTIPIGLTNGVNALWIGDTTVGNPNHEFDNAYFNCGGSLSTVTGIRAAVNNAANWVIDNTTTPQFTLPRNCTFIGVTAINGLNLFAKENSNYTNSLQWKLEEPSKIDKFSIEKSTDGIVFKTISTITASSPTNKVYYYTDNDLFAKNNYYRIKVTESSGKIYYSNIVTLFTKSKIEVLIYPNPVSNNLIIRQDGAIFFKQAQLLSTTGVMLKQINITSKQYSVNVKGLSTGLYYLKVSEGNIIKIIKQ